MSWGGFLPMRKLKNNEFIQTSYQVKSIALLQMSQWLSRNGVRHVVLCPGSRSAPLTLAIARSGLMKIFTGVDERSAGFAGLGLALGTQRPVVVVCTSGTALLNLGPAVAEAFYLRLPLVILSADRPAGYEGQQRGQVIRQNGVLDHHLRAFFRWAPDEPAWDVSSSEKLFDQAFATAMNECGPIHINVPLCEPLYENQEIVQTQIHSPSIGNKMTLKQRQIKSSIVSNLQGDLMNALETGKKIWFLAGMNRPDEGLRNILQDLQNLGVGCIWHEDLANIKAGIPIRDEWFRTSPLDVPSLLISWGGPLVSKHLQLFLRHNPHFKHWRIDPRGDCIDTYNRLDGVWKSSPELALKSIHNIIQKFVQKNPLTARFPSDKPKSALNALALKSVVDFDQKMRIRYPNLPFSDALALSVVLPYLKYCRVHLGNSSLVRKFLALPWDKSEIKSIHCNRGTSGIEGSVSTAIGEAWAHPEDSLWILNGDLATAYDAGAWMLEPRPSVKMVILNNGGGDIFRELPGSSIQPECEQLFATPRSIQWSSWCQGYGRPHRLATDLDSLREGLNWLSALEGTGFLEILTHPSPNRQAEKILREGIES